MLFGIDTSALEGITLGRFSLSSLATALALLAVCLLLSRGIMKLFNKAMGVSRIERSLHAFLRESLRITLYIITGLLVADALGVPMASLIAVLGAAGLAVSLAIQGTLANLAGGIMLLVSKPFMVGDHVEAGGVGGIVEEIGLVYTRIVTFDNKVIFAPNSDIASAKITNYTTQGRRRVDITVGVPGDADRETVRDALRAAAARHPEALSTPPIFINIVGYKESSLDYALRLWVKTEDFWNVYFALLEEVREELDARGVGLPYPRVTLAQRQD